MKIMAHRGNKVLFPENSMAAFRSAVELGADGIECDLHLTKDGELVIIHDETPDRTSDTSGTIAEMTLQEIKAARLLKPNGEVSDEQVPALFELIYYLNRKEFNGLLNLELKTDQYDYPGIEQALIKELEYLQPQFCIVFSSFNWYSLVRLKQISPKAPVAVLVEEALLPYLERIPEVQPEAVHLDIDLYRDDILARLGDYPIRLWTVNNVSDWQRFCAQPERVTALMTDDPAQALWVKEHLHDEAK